MQVRIPHFLRDEAAYRVKLDAIAALNGINTLSTFSEIFESAGKKHERDRNVKRDSEAEREGARASERGSKREKRERGGGGAGAGGGGGGGGQDPPPTKTRLSTDTRASKRPERSRERGGGHAGGGGGGLTVCVGGGGKRSERSRSLSSLPQVCICVRCGEVC
jgi:hypothetical protein